MAGTATHVLMTLVHNRGALVLGRRPSTVFDGASRRSQCRCAPPVAPNRRCPMRSLRPELIWAAPNTRTGSGSHVFKSLQRPTSTPQGDADASLVAEALGRSGEAHIVKAVVGEWTGLASRWCRG
jgi:hypothetical protein